MFVFPNLMLRSLFHYISLISGRFQVTSQIVFRCPNISILATGLFKMYAFMQERCEYEQVNLQAWMGLMKTCLFEK